MMDAVPALIESDADDPWPARGALGGGTATSADVTTGSPARTSGRRSRRNSRRATSDQQASARPGQPAWPISGLLVADLSAMWAGPLCGQLLARAGATVVKVESRARPDGTRAGLTDHVLRLDEQRKAFRTPSISDEPSGIRLLARGRRHRHRVIPPRGARPAAVSAQRPRDGQVWLRITGHGADGERRELGGVRRRRRGVRGLGLMAAMSEPGSFAGTRSPIR